MTITIQSTYATGYAVGFPGMVANGEESNRISRTVEDVAGIGFGKPAFRGAADHGCTMTPTAGAFMGVVISDAGYPQGVNGSTVGAVDTLPRYETAGLLNEGCIYVTAGVNVTAGDAAFVDGTGAFLKAGTAIPATYDQTVSSGGIVRLRVRRS